jgi:hypothetical protein
MSKLKPIHKFNGGLGATLCNECRAIINNGLTDDILCPKCTDDNLFNDKYFPDEVPEKKTIHKYKLVRHDGLTRVGNNIMWVEFGDDSYFKSKHDEPAIKRSFVLDFVGITFTWMTTTIDEIIENREDYIKFKTKNSTYELFINIDNN